MLANRFAQQLRRSRIALYSFLPFAALAAASTMDYVQPVLRLVYIVAGFSLIIFLHELGHFVVARLCSVKCLAFSIGIGPRMCGWRKHGRLTFGNDPYDITDAKNVDAAKQPVVVEVPLKHPAHSTQADLPTTAHEPHHSPAIGDCDYRISWLPLGGYVRMLGQDDMDPTKVSADPHAFNQRPIWQRMCIVSAGVIMNVIFAAVCFSIIFSPGIGVDFPPARVGSVTYGMPAWDSDKIHMGDQIVSINGEKPRGFLEFTDVMMAAALASNGQQITLDVIPHDADPNSKPIPVTLVPKRSDSTGFLAFGIDALPGLKIATKGTDLTTADARKATLAIPSVFDKNIAELNKLTDAGWKIVGVDDGTTSVDLKDAPEPNATHDKYVKFYDFVNHLNGAPINIALQNVKSGATQTIRLYPHLEFIPGEREFPTVMGLSPQVLVGDPVPNYPAAKAGLKEGDRILAIGDRAMPTHDQFPDIIQHSDCKPFNIRVERNGVTHDFSVTGIRRKDGLTQIGLPYPQDLATTRFVVDSTSDSVSALAGLNLTPQSYIAAIDGTPVNNWQEIYGLLRTKSPDSTVRITLATVDMTKAKVHNWTGDLRSVTLAFTKDDANVVGKHIHFLVGLPLENETKNQQAANAGDAVLMGMDHTKKFILNVYMTLAGLFRGTVDPSNLHGIVGITKVGYDVQQRGPVWLWYILAMVSVNLAVANFLPLPIVDGGLFLLLILEKIRGRPLPLKIQAAIQTVGIVALASLFLYVTMNDIKLF